MDCRDATLGSSVSSGSTAWVPTRSSINRVAMRHPRDAACLDLDLCRAVEMSLADWRRQMAVNLDGVVLSVKYAVPAMRGAGGGSIMIMSSAAGLRRSPGLAGCCATKGGGRLFAKAVAMECAAAEEWHRDQHLSSPDY
jgi:NAD(P)-dependent dehydrogenase (short-subunit alcohol dehydrogenase family)